MSEATRPKTYAEVREHVLDSLDSDVVGDTTIPFAKLSQPEIDAIIADAKADGIKAEWEDWLNQVGDFTNISFSYVESSEGE